MNKSILKSETPKRCEQIANGKCTMLLSKTLPKLEPPFKGYLYCIKSKDRLRLIDVYCKKRAKDPIRMKTCRINNLDYCTNEIINGKVIGEFVVDKVTRYQSEFWDDDTYESIHEVVEPQDFEECGEYDHYGVVDNGDDNYKDHPLLKSLCMSWEELRERIGQGIHDFYTLHISQVKIYDTPKELG